MAEAEIVAWLDRFATLVRSQDYSSARQLFTEDVYSFGTRAHAMRGLDQLVESQWRMVWGVTRGFHFKPPIYTSFPSSSDDLAVTWALWASAGIRSDGSSFERTGRATFALKKTTSWVCIHSHFSMSPGPSA